MYKPDEKPLIKAHIVMILTYVISFLLVAAFFLLTPKLAPSVFTEFTLTLTWLASAAVAYYQLEKHNFNYRGMLAFIGLVITAPLHALALTFLMDYYFPKHNLQATNYS